VLGEEAALGVERPAFSLNTTTHSKDLMDALTMFRMLLLGSIITQSGEELGLQPLDLTKVEDRVEKNHLTLYSLLADQLRHQEILFGQLTAENGPGYILLTNFGREEATVDVSKVTHIAESIRVMECGGLVAEQVEEERL
jgi:hypothetical protein